MADDYKPRFSFEITEEQMLRANNILSTYGLRKAIFGKILDDVLDVIETNAGMAVGLLMSEKVVMQGIMSILENARLPKKTKKNGGT